MDKKNDMAYPTGEAPALWWGMDKIIKTCGTCVYPSFGGRVNGCLAPMKVGDPRRGKFVSPDTQCFTGQYTENNKRRGEQIKAAVNIGAMKKILKGEREP